MFSGEVVLNDLLFAQNFDRVGLGLAFDRNTSNEVFLFPSWDRSEERKEPFLAFIIIFIRVLAIISTVACIQRQYFSLREFLAPLLPSGQCRRQNLKLFARKMADHSLPPDLRPKRFCLSIVDEYVRLIEPPRDTKSQFTSFNIPGMHDSRR